MLTDLGAAAKREIQKVDSITVNNGEGSCAALGICARVRGVVTELEEMSGLPERRLLKVGPVPLLCVD